MKIQMSRSRRGHPLESQWQQEIVFWLFCLIVSLAIIISALETIHAAPLRLKSTKPVVPVATSAAVSTTRAIRR